LVERRKVAIKMRTEVIPPEAHAVMTDLGQAIAECENPLSSLDELERADMETDFSDWLESHGAKGALASDLLSAGITSQQLEPLTKTIHGDQFTRGLQLLIADHQILCLSREIEDSVRRISELIQAVKSYSYMDQSPYAEVDVESGIDVTLRMFQYQLKHGVEVKKDFAANLPRIQANGSELNQVWTNMIDNAIHSMRSNGGPRILQIRTALEPSGVMVEIGDNGPGIPPEIQGKIFDPFFTTKKVGEGTGLGLDIVQRIVRKHKGTIRVESAPGRTVFQVRFPLPG
jgi:signal transduction histidine kinase